jgi:hypothetical protein
MKRMDSEVRKRYAQGIVDSLANAWQCRAGEWNMKKLLREVERNLRNRRLYEKRSKHPS